MRSSLARWLVAAGLLLALDAGAAEAVTIKMVLNNAQAREVRDGAGAAVAVELTKAQKALVRSRAPRFMGGTIRVRAGQLSPANKISLTILRPGTATPVLRVEARGTRATDESGEDAASRSLIADIAVEISNLGEWLSSHADRLEAMANRLRRGE